MKVTVKTHLHQEGVGENTRYLFFPNDMSEYGYALIGEREIEVEVPDDYDPRPIIANALRKEQTKIRAESERKINALEERIQSLLALPSEVQA